MAAVGRAGRNAYRRQSHGRRQQVEAAVQRFGKNAQAIGIQAHRKLQSCQGKGRDQRNQRGAMLFSGAVFVPEVLHEYSL